MRTDGRHRYPNRVLDTRFVLRPLKSRKSLYYASRERYGVSPSKMCLRCAPWQEFREFHFEILPWLKERTISRNYPLRESTKTFVKVLRNFPLSKPQNRANRRRKGPLRREIRQLARSHGLTCPWPPQYYRLHTPYASSFVFMHDNFLFSPVFFSCEIFSAAKCGARAEKSTMSRLRVAHLPEFHAKFLKFPLDGCESAKSNSPLQRAKFLPGPRHARATTSRRGIPCPT